MRDDDILILRGGEVASLLAGRETEVMDVVARAYLAHGRGETRSRTRPSSAFPTTTSTVSLPCPPTWVTASASPA